MSVIVVTGIQAAGKSTVAQALAKRFDRSVHLRGDVFRRMVVSGRAEMGPANPPVEAVRQLELRYALAATVADQYARAGFTVVLQDIVLGRHLADLVATVESRPLSVVVLAPRADVVQAGMTPGGSRGARWRTGAETKVWRSRTRTCGPRRPASACGCTRPHLDDLLLVQAVGTHRGELACLPQSTAHGVLARAARWPATRGTGPPGVLPGSGAPDADPNLA